MIIEDGIKLDFKDVLFKPMRSELKSRSQVNLNRKMKFKHSEHEWEGVPIISANMDTTGTFETAEVLGKEGILTAIHKHYTIDEWKQFIDNATNDTLYNIIPSLGISDNDLNKFEKIIELFNFKFVCIDIANGYGEHFPEFVKKVRKLYPDKIIIAGNVVSGDMTQELIMAGADIVKVGIGPGSVCTTRIQTGVGMPQLSAIIDCANVAHGLGGHIIADGGCTCPGDVSKAFGGGADFVMLGGMLAGHDESGGELITRWVEDGFEWDKGQVRPRYKEEEYKKFYGMSSEVANEKYAGGLKKYRSSEGREVVVKYRGALANTVQDLLGGIRSTATYIGSRNIKDIPKCTTFVRVSQQFNGIYSK